MTLRKNVASQTVCFTMMSSTTGAPTTGLTVTAYVTLDGADAAPGGSVTEIANGRYKFAPSQGDTNGVEVQYLFTATGAIPVERVFYTTVLNPGDAVRMGMTALPNAAADAAGGLPISDAGGFDVDAILTRLPAALTANGNMKADTLRIGGTVQTAGDVVAVAAAVKVQTDKLTFTVANVLDSNMLRIKGTVVNGNGGGTPWGP